MTTNQATQLATSPSTKKALATLKKFAEAEANFKQLELAKKEAEAQLIDAMDQYGVPKIEGDWGYITLATRKSFKAVGEVGDEFTKKALDTKKVAAHYTLNGDLPINVEVSETKYLTKKISL